MTCPNQSSRGDANAQFAAIHTAEWKWRVAHGPPDEDHPDYTAPKMPDVGEAQQQDSLARWQGVLAQLDRIDTEALSPARAIDYRVYRFQIETLIADQRFNTWQRPLSGDAAFWSDVQYAARVSRLDEASIRDYIALLHDIPRYFAENIANMRLGLARGFTLPQITVQGRDAGVANLLGITTLADDPLFAPLVAMPETIAPERQVALRQQAADAIARKVRPAHAELFRFLREEYIPGAQTSIAARDLPDGEAFYQAQVAKYTTTPMSPEEIHALGLEHVDLLRGQMMQAMKKTGFGGRMPEFLAYLRRDSQFYADEPQSLLNRARWIVSKIDDQIPAFFGRLPRRGFSILPVPDDVAPSFTGGRGGLGYFLINTYNLAARPLYALPALTLHEATPGHAFQMALAVENPGLPPFRRETPIAAYAEGWAVYCERLGEEMGIYETPYERFGMLSYQMWRAARLVVDTGLHAFGWSRCRAQQYLRDHTALSDHEIVTEVDRYIAWPAQALSYFVGALHFFHGRRRAENALGARFDIRAFHDAVLAIGPVPLDVLDAAVDDHVSGARRHLEGNAPPRPSGKGCD